MEAGRASFGDEYVEYHSGSGAWPVVLAAPHGGMLMPEAVPDRTSGVAEPDWKSYELATAVLESFRDAGAEAGAPALVALMLDRRKLDGNRCRAQCCEPLTNITGLGKGPRQHATDQSIAEPESRAVRAWDTYHGFLADALATAVDQHGFCLLLDVHGQSHRTGVTELGYLLTSEDLLLPDDAIDSKHPRPSSIDTLLQIPRGQSKSLAGLVRGRQSLGAFLETRGFPCTPSPATPQPVQREALFAARDSAADITATKGPPPEAAAAATYFWGAYSIRRYAASATVPVDMNPLSDTERARWASKVAAVQLETSWTGVRESAETRLAFGRALCEVRTLTSSGLSRCLSSLLTWQPRMIMSSLVCDRQRKNFYVQQQAGVWTPRTPLGMVNCNQSWCGLALSVTQRPKIPGIYVHT